MPNRYLIAAVQMVDLRGFVSLTIRAGVSQSADLLAAQAVATFCADHTGFSPVAVVSAEVDLEALERAVAILKGESPAEIPKRRGRRPRLPVVLSPSKGPGTIPARQDPLPVEKEATFAEHLRQGKPGGAWGKLHSDAPLPDPAPCEDEPEPEPEPESQLERTMKAWNAP